MDNGRACAHCRAADGTCSARWSTAQSSAPSNQSTYGIETTPCTRGAARAVNNGAQGETGNGDQRGAVYQTLPARPAGWYLMSGSPPLTCPRPHTHTHTHTLAHAHQTTCFTPTSTPNPYAGGGHRQCADNGLPVAQVLPSHWPVQQRSLRRALATCRSRSACSRPAGARCSRSRPPRCRTSPRS